MAKQNQNGNLKTPEGRVSFPNVFEKSDYSDKFEVTLLFPPGTDLSALKAEAIRAAKEKWGDKVPRNLRSPFRDAAEKDGLDGYEAGWTFVSFRGNRRPGIVDQNVQPIMSDDEFYPGCWAIVSCRAYAYGGPGTSFTPGVAFGLQNIQKRRDDDSFAGGVSAEDDFDPMEGAQPAAAMAGADDDIFGDAGADDDIPF